MERVPGSTEAGLHFVCDEQRSGAAADVRYRVGERAGQRANTAFTSDWFRDDCCCFVADGRVQRFGGIRIDEGDGP